MARKWLHDGSVPKHGEPGEDTRPRLPNGEVDWSVTKHRHVMLLDKRCVVIEGVQVPANVAGHTCNYENCGESDDLPQCSAEPYDRWGQARCGNRGTVIRDEQIGLRQDRSVPRIELPSGAGWHFCGMHDPVAKREREARAREQRTAERAPYDELRAAERALEAEVRRWHADESAIEGFCEGDECEHHECRLHRALVRIDRAREATDAAWKARKNR